MLFFDFYDEKVYKEMERGETWDNVNPKYLGTLTEADGNIKYFLCGAEDGDYFDDQHYWCCGKCGERLVAKHPEGEEEEIYYAPLDWTDEKGTVLEKNVLTALFFCGCKCRHKITFSKKESWQIKQKAEEQKYKVFSELYGDVNFDRMRFSRDDGKSPKAMELCRKYAENFGEMRYANHGLLLYGGAGTGKTFAACCIVNSIIEGPMDEGNRPWNIMMTQLPLLTFKMGKNYGDDVEKILESLVNYDLVVIDDFGIERQTETAMERAYLVIDTLYRAKVTTIITTNLSLKEFQNPARKENARLFSRIMEMCRPIKMNEVCRRMELAKSKFDDFRALLGEDASNEAK